MINIESIIRGMVPEIILEDKDSAVFIRLMTVIFNDIIEYIDKFPDLADPDTTPEIFLPKLSQLLKYSYRYDIDVEFQREIIKRMVHVYRSRGTDDSIIMAASFGDDPKWVGDHVFLPGADKDVQLATLTYPTDKIFRHNVSKHSRGGVYADSSRWRSGVLIIEVPRLNDEIRKAIRKVIPAGIKFYFVIVNDILSDDDNSGEYGEVSFGEWTLTAEYMIDYSLVIQDRLMNTSSFSKKKTSKQYLSGRQVLFKYYEVEKSLSSTMIPKYSSGIFNDLSYTIPGVDFKKFHVGVPKHSTPSAKFSGKYGLSGSFTAEICSMVNFTDISPMDVPQPDDKLYDLLLEDSVGYYNSGFDVDIEKVS